MGCLTRTHMHTHILTLTHTHTNTHTHLNTHMNTYSNTHAHTHKDKHLHIFKIHTQIHAQKHTHTHAHPHTHMPTHSHSGWLRLYKIFQEAAPPVSDLRLMCHLLNNCSLYMSIIFIIIFLINIILYWKQLIISLP